MVQECLTADQSLVDNTAVLPVEFENHAKTAEWPGSCILNTVKETTLGKHLGPIQELHQWKYAQTAGIEAEMNVLLRNTLHTYIRAEHKGVLRSGKAVQSAVTERAIE